MGNKIVHIVDYFQPQLGYQEAALAKFHALQGHDVTVLTSDRYFPFPDYEKTYSKILGNRIIETENENLEGYKVVRLKPKFEYSAFTLLPEIVDKLNEINPDIVIHHDFLKPNIYYTLKAKEVKNFKLVVDSHAAEYNSNLNSISSKLYLFLYKRIILPKLKDVKIITTGKNEQKYLKRFLKLDSEIQNLGADLSKFKPDDQIRQEVRQKLGYSDKDIVIIHAGKLNTDKKSDLVLTTYLNLKFQFSNLKLILIGNGDVEIPSTSSIKHFDFVENPELNNYLNAADIGVWPGSKSNIMLEAIAVGLPIILENKEYALDLTENQNGFNVSTPKELEDKLKLLISNKDLRQQMGTAGRILSQSKFDWKILANKFIT